MPPSVMDLPPEAYAMVKQESLVQQKKLVKRFCGLERRVIFCSLVFICGLIAAVTFLSLKLALGGQIGTEGKANTTVDELYNRTRNTSEDDLEQGGLGVIYDGGSKKADKKDKHKPKKPNVRRRPAASLKLNYTSTERMKRNETLVWQTGDLDGVTFIQGRLNVTDDGPVYVPDGGVYRISLQVKFDSVNNNMDRDKKFIHLFLCKISARGYAVVRERKATLYKGEYRYQDLTINLRLRKHEGFFVSATWKYLNKKSDAHRLDVVLFD